MLEELIINSIDTINIIYLWAVLEKKDSDKYRLFGIMGLCFILITIGEQIGINFITIYVITIILLKLIYEKKFKDVIFGFFIVLLTNMIMQLISSIIIDVIIDKVDYRGIFVELSTLLMVNVFSRTRLRQLLDYQKVQDGNILVYFISTSCTYVVAYKIIWNYDNKIVLNNVAANALIMSILLTSQVFIYLYISGVIKEREKLKISNECNAIITETVEEIKQRQHDFANYKNTIKGIVEVLDEKDVKQAIMEYIKDEDSYDNNINNLIYIDNIVIKSIVYRSLCKAKKYNINFIYQIENDVLENALNYQDTSNVLNNLLNNAFDEVMKEECLKKEIELKIIKKENVPHLIVKNQIADLSNIDLNKIFERGYSTKNSGTRGYGLYNVQNIINSNKGCIKLQIDSGKLIFDGYFLNN